MDRRLLALCMVASLTAVSFPACFADETIDMSATPVVDNGVTGSATGTDPTSLDREKESMSAVGKRIREGAEQYVFQAEVNRLMDIIINSLYSNKDIFLRELISNASDALDKIRFLSLTDKSLLGEGDTSKLEIKIHLDKENNVLYIRDRGIGMTKEDLIKNLGTIAKSGTSAFLESMQKGGDVNLIGQFGVGFYSVYLVADWVEVVTKHNDDKQYIWSSSAGGSFSIVEDTENEPLGRGTMIKLHLKEEAQEYADVAKLKELVTKYSEFMNFPIYLLTTKEVDVPVEEEEEEKKEETADDKAEDETEEDEGVEDEEEEEEETEEEKPKKTKKESRTDWELLNDNKALWLRNPGDVTDEEYQKFYKAVSKDYGEAQTWAHFKAEGDVEFRSIVFIPKTTPYDFYDKYYEKAPRGLKLYVRRVFISDDMDELLPRYLSFIRGIVDSDSLPLNVSRETLQQHAALKTIKKKLVRKVLDLIKKMADDEKKCKEQKESTEESEEADDAKIKQEDCDKYGKFFENFGRAMKLGVIEDTTNRNRLAKLLRFHTSKSPDKLTSLDEYIERMKDGQKNIYYLAGQTKEEVANSPFLERLVTKGYEVIYFTDVLDEYVMQHLLEYDDKKFQNASKEDLKLADKDEKEKKRDKELKEEFKDLTKWWKTLLGDKVTGVKVSNRLTKTPCVVVTSKYGSSSNMERIQKAQAFSDPSRAGYMKAQRSLEINPRHPLVQTLKEKVAADESDPKVKSVANSLYETALLESGFMVEDVKDFSTRMYEMMKTSLGVHDLDVTKVEEEVEEPEEAEETQPEEVEATEEEAPEQLKDEL